jgi:hypothetical protein
MNHEARGAPTAKDRERACSWRTQYERRHDPRARPCPGRPQWATVALLEKVRSVLSEYAQYLPLTVRQIFYRLFGAHGYDNTEHAYARLGEHLNRAQRARLIAFDTVRNDGINFAEPLAWDGRPQQVQTFLHHADQFRPEPQQRQARCLVCSPWAAGMVRRIAAPFGIAEHSSGVFDDPPERLGELAAVELLRIGDLDPSGVHLFSSLPERLDTLLNAYWDGTAL